MITDGWPIGRIPHVLPKDWRGQWIIFLPGSRRKVIFSEEKIRSSRWAAEVLVAEAT